MAGLGRRTHYRKHLTDSIIYDYPEPSDNECIAKVVATRGGNQFDIVLPLAKDHQNEEQQLTTQEGQLAILPTKFNKLVWVKRNDFVIVETATTDDDNNSNNHDNENRTVPANDDNHATATATTTKEPNKASSVAEDTGGIRYIISHILYKDQVKHLQSKGLWPSHDKEFATDKIGLQNRLEEDADTGVGADSSHADNMEEKADDGIVYDVGYEDDDFLVNTNRLATLKVDDDDSSDSDSS